MPLSPHIQQRCPPSFFNRHPLICLDRSVKIDYFAHLHLVAIEDDRAWSTPFPSDYVLELSISDLSQQTKFALKPASHAADPFPMLRKTGFMVVSVSS